MQDLRPPADTNAALVLADGTVFFGYGIGIEGQSIGEICFNTSITGYQEILTDPSYTGQIITFTFPHIGNTGINAADYESKSVGARGLVLRENITNPANFRSQKHFNDWLIENKITGICGIDTRALTRYIRLNGAQNAQIAFYKDVDNISTKALINSAAKYPTLKGTDLASRVTCNEPYEWAEETWSLEPSDCPPEQGEGSHHADGDFSTTLCSTQNDKIYHVVAVDFGVKHNILRCLVDLGCRVTVVPATTSAQQILDYNPDGIFLSNGPGDPSATGAYAVPVIKTLIESGLPIFGICLGHQMLSIALGCTTYKMHQGHRGGNHPVQNLDNTVVEITSQNHGFAVTADSLPENVTITHKSLFDGTIEGIRLGDRPVFSVQHHPEASPGPKDSYYLFKQFVGLMEGVKSNHLIKGIKNG